MFEPYQRGGREGPPRNNLEYWCRPLPGFRHPTDTLLPNNRQDEQPGGTWPLALSGLTLLVLFGVFTACVSLTSRLDRAGLNGRYVQAPSAVGAERRRRRPAPRGGPRPVLPRSVAAG